MAGNGSCPVSGAYNDYPGIIMSNGYNTYVAGNCWADPGCSQLIQANDGTDWQVTATQPAGNGSVEVAPEIQQQTNDWCAATGTWDSGNASNCPSGDTNVPIASLNTWTSSYSETMPHNPATIAQYAYDIWSNYASDIMVWQDVVNRCNTGAFGSTTLATGVHIGNYIYDVYRYGGPGAEVIFVAEGSGGMGTCGNYPSGTVDILGVLREAEALGLVSSMTVPLVDGTWEICSTGGVPETFALSTYTMSTS